MVDTSKLNEAIREAGLRKDRLARSLGISRQAFSSKINNKTEFKAKESLYLMTALDLTPESFVEIFFAEAYDSQPYNRRANA